MFRRWLLLLMCLALPLQAPAFTWQAQSPCPMEAEMAALLAAGELAAKDLPDCCNDAETFARTGKACKTGQECAATLLALPPARVVGATGLLRHEPPPFATSTWDAAPPANLWRPPAVL
jgi:hypothetical protein